MRQFHCHLDSFPDAVLGEYVNLALARFSLRHHNPKLHTAGFRKILYLRAKTLMVEGAARYNIYAAKCGEKNKLTHVATVTGTSKVIRTIDSKKLRKGKYYKFMVISVDSGDIIQSSSTIQHVATKGGKVGNYKSVKTRAKKNKVRLKEGKVFKLKARALKQSRKKIVRKHVAMRYESSNEMIAKVSSKGKIKAVSRGTCYVCAYAQNGVYKRIRVRVK